MFVYRYTKSHWEYNGIFSFMYHLHPHLSFWLSHLLSRLLISNLLFKLLPSQLIPQFPLRGSQIFMIQNLDYKFCNWLDRVNPSRPSFLKNHQGFSSQKKAKILPERLSHGCIQPIASSTISYLSMKNYSLSRLVRSKTTVNITGLLVPPSQPQLAVSISKSKEMTKEQ